MKKLFLILTMAVFAFCVSSCSNDEDDTPKERTTEQVTAKFKSYFCNEDGTLHISPVKGENNAWSFACEDATAPCKIFSDMTGLEIAVASQYDFRYDLPDSQGFIRIRGHAIADGNAVYAIMYVNLPAYPQVSSIYIVAPKYFDNEN